MATIYIKQAINSAS